tara:strand:- start:1778 stop:2428 length:651 start_codon:yes stop_codon:yes gene_type:complete
MLTVLELFAGSRSVGKAAEKLGLKTFSSDINAFDGIDYVVDILEFDLNKIPFKVDILWASPPCTSFSILQIGRNWNHNNTPKTEDAVLGMKLVLKTIEIIRILKPKYWFIENPRGKLRKLDFMKPFQRVTVWYCQYGDRRAKPTDIWSNNIRSLYCPGGWKPRPECRNANPNCNHDRSPRGDGSAGVQGQADNFERSQIPQELCLEVLKSCHPYRT